jgi:uncharacterized protein (TIGR02118 family)
MIKVSVMYANEEGKEFDMDYYCKRHMPIVQEKICKALLKLEIDEGLGGGAPGAPASYIAMGHFYFDSVESFQTIFAPHADDIMADIPNYTDIEPSIQVSEVKI